MKKLLVYDLPLRLFHWIFALLFVTAFFIGKTMDDHAPNFPYHMMAGLLMAFVVALRLVWGFSGSRNSRFSSFSLKPSELMAYIIGQISGDRLKWGGHNPASSWAAIAMLALALGMAATGLLMINGNKKAFEEIHEILAHVFLVVAIVHVAGVLYHSIRYRDMIGLAMLHGKKADVIQSDSVSKTHPLVALLFLGIVVAFAMNMARSYNPQTQVLSLFGQSLQLGESEGSEREGGDRGEHESEHDEDGEHK